MTAYSLTEILEVAAKMKRANAVVSGAMAHSRVEFGPVDLRSPRERDIAVNLPDLLIQHLPKLRTERPKQPIQIKAGQVWQSRKSGGQIRIVEKVPYGNLWVRVSGNGHREGNCATSTLRDKYDYVEG